MLKIFAANVIVSKGYGENPAISVSEKGDAARFRVGQRVYDPKAENNTRWLNLTVKAFGHICERIKKMQLHEGSVINFTGRLDEDSWTDKETGEAKSMNVVILDDIEFAGGGKKDGDRKTAADAGAAGSYRRPGNQPMQQNPQYATNGRYAGNTQSGAEYSDNFTGYEPFGMGGGDFFDLNG